MPNLRVAPPFATALLGISLALASAAPAFAQDCLVEICTLRAQKTGVPGEVELTWQDPDGSPTVYCINRGAAPTGIPLLVSTPDLLHFDVPPAGLWHYDVVEPASGACAPGPCAASGVLTCGASWSARNDDPGSSTALDDHAPCGLAGLDGPEIARTFVATEDAPVTATLSGLVTNLDILVVLDDGSGCNPANCVASGDNSVTWNAVAGATYLLIVDGAAGAAGAFTLDVECATDACAIAGVLDCGGAVAGDSSLPGVPDLALDYGSCGLADATGPELAYELTPAVTGNVDLLLSTGNPELRLLVLEDAGSGCRTPDCIAVDLDGDGALSFPGVAGQRYFVMVDGLNGASGPFSVSASCGPPPSSTCDPFELLLCNGRAGFGDTSVADAGPGDGLSDAIDSYGCSPHAYPGQERVFLFSPAGTGQVTLTLNPGGGVDLDVMVLRGSCGQGATCVAFGDTSAVFNVVAGESFYLVVDGRDGATGSFSLQAACAFPPTSCAPAASLSCGEFLYGNNGSSGSSDVNDSYAGCAGSPDASGPEYVYQFVPPPLGQSEPIVVTAGFDLVVGELDLYVTRGSCAASACIAWGDGSVTFTAEPGEQYFIIVDGRAGDVSDYRVFIDPSTCLRAPRPCLPLPTPVSCGSSLTGQSNGQPGSTDNIDSYPSCSIVRVFDESGPEVAYSLTPPSSGPVTVQLTNVTGGIVHLYVLEENGAGCVADSCIQMGVFSVTFDAAAGTTYYVLVDGTEGAVASFDVSFTCA